MIAVMLLTYNRTEYAMRTLRSVVENLVGEPLWLHIADDGSRDEHRDAVWNLANAYLEHSECPVAGLTMTNAERKGYGASYNLGTQVCHDIADIILPLEDDWELVRPLDISPIVNVLRDKVFGCVRMGDIGYTQELRGKFVWAEHLQWLELDPNSPERHVFAGHPRLEHRDWERKVGPWPDGTGELAGHVEFEVSGWDESREGVAWPIDLIHPRGDAFVHIGAIQSEDA